jgi:hypothetical protein
MNTRTLGNQQFTETKVEDLKPRQFLYGSGWITQVKKDLKAKTVTVTTKVGKDTLTASYSTGAVVTTVTTV